MKDMSFAHAHSSTASAAPVPRRPSGSVAAPGDGAAGQPQAWRLDAAGATDRGTVRPSNQDCFEVVSDVGLLIVADGMGGHAAGDVASQMATTTVLECLRECGEGQKPTEREAWPFGHDPAASDTANRLRTAFQVAHLRLLEASVLNPELRGMGTTLVVAQRHGDRLIVAWAGDSRLYVADDHGCRLVTRDDTWLESVLDEHPHASPEDIAVLRQHPLRHALTNVVGSAGRTDVHIVDLPLTAGMVVALTTDGVHGALADDEIGRVLDEEPLPARAAAELVAAAMDAGSTDNCTAVVGRFTPLPPTGGGSDADRFRL